LHCQVIDCLLPKDLWCYVATIKIEIMPDCSSLASTGSAGYGAGLEQEAWSRKLMQLEKHLDLYICSYPFGAYSKPNATPGGMAITDQPFSSDEAPQ
jgi:hypothetical protein